MFLMQISVWFGFHFLNFIFSDTSSSIEVTTMDILLHFQIQAYIWIEKSLILDHFLFTQVLSLFSLLIS